MSLLVDAVVRSSIVLLAGFGVSALLAHRSAALRHWVLAAAVFAAAAALLRHLRTDPLLPAELLPTPWPADQLRERYAAHLASIQALIRGLAGGDGA